MPLNILSADIYTRGDNVALDVFRVSDLSGSAVTDPRDMALVEATLKKALETEAFDLSGSLEEVRKKGRRRIMTDLEFPSRVSVDNHTDPHFTLIEIQTPDRIGLLHDLLQCFNRSEIDIALSRISTESGAAIDTFYVTDRRTRSKITNAQRIDALQAELHRAGLPPA